MSNQNPQDPQTGQQIGQQDRGDEIKGAELVETIVTGILVGIVMSLMENFTTIFIMVALTATIATLLLRKLGEDQRRLNARVAYSKTTWITSAAGIASVAIKTAEIFLLH